jgi:DNA-dependent RNA polymerase auxiliary subunit epsilon
MRYLEMKRKKMERKKIEKEDEMRMRLIRQISREILRYGKEEE